MPDTSQDSRALFLSLGADTVLERERASHDIDNLTAGLKFRFLWTLQADWVV